MKRYLFYFIFLCAANQGLAQGVSQGRYWINDNFSQATTVTINSETANFNLNYSSLPIGYYQISFQFKQASNNLWSAPVTQWFYKSTSPGSSPAAYRYWINDDITNAVTVNGSIDNLDLTLPLTDLPIGYYRANFQFRDASGKWSSTVSSWVYKTNSNNQLVRACRYWFDNDVSNAKTIVMKSATYDPVITKMDVEKLSLGIHSVNIQFQDDGGAWSSVVTSTLYRNNITSRLITEPKLYVQQSLLNPGETQLIWGNDFTGGGQINLMVQNNRGEIIPNNASFNNSSTGSFSYQLPITSSMQDGEYMVTATDATTGSTTPVIKFRVNNSIAQKLWVSEPSSNGNYLVNVPLGINWSSFVSATDAIGISGLIPKKYKVEYSNNNGVTWQLIENFTSTKAQSNQTNSFKISHAFPTAGNYIIKISDLDDLTNFNTTSFSVGESSASGFKVSLEWDHSIPKRSDKPVGVAADGTSRVYIKLTRDKGNHKSVKNITAQISPKSNGDNSSGPELLGKILFAKDTLKYSLEGNSASSTSNTMPLNSSLANYLSFWYVAPDDFTQELNNQDAERTVKVTFNISYTDNTSTSEETTIRIARPPLMLVHGLGGDKTTWDKFKYNVDGTTRYFMYADGSDGLFKNSDITLNLKNYESFKNNADILLGVGDQNYGTQSFQSFIKQMNNLGFANNRVDYVGHSMGGSIARTALSPEYDFLFRPSLSSERQYKNYGKGFINKLITINSPHNGSKWADLISLSFSLLAPPVQDAIGSLLSLTDIGKGSFIKKPSIIPFLTSYEISPAIKNLRAVYGGVIFNATSVKNHLIGSGWSKLNLIDNSVSGKAIMYSVNLILPKNSEYEYFNNTDGVVSTPSQFPSIDILKIPQIDIFPLSQFPATLGYRNELLSHMSFKNDILIGTKVMRLLNSPINSNFFADQISANSSSFLKYTKISEAGLNSIDSIKSYVDKNYIEITEPNASETLLVDSTVNFKVLLKDTLNLQKIQMIFQGELYQTDSKDLNQTFNIKIHSNSIGNNLLVANALYDSLGYTVYHTDTATYLVQSIDTLKGFYVTPHSRIYNRNEIFQPLYNAVFTSYVGTLNNNADSITFSIADTNVVNYNISLEQFATKDTGTTYIVFKYKNFTDTSFIYVSLPPDFPDLTFTGKVFLQGAYNTSVSKMNNTLNTSGVLTTNAINQPFNTSTFKYNSYEHVTGDFFAQHPDIVDWVLVELRDSTSPDKVISQKAALLRQDGSLMESNGSTAGITFSNILPGNYYVVVRHRNHLGIRSSTTIDFTTGSGSYDFTTSANKSFQNQAYTSTVSIGGVWAMRAGDANSNGVIKYNGPGNDQNQILNIKLSGSLGNTLNNYYSPEDINMNGNIKWNGPGNDQNFLLNAILNGSLSTIFIEQL